MHYSQHSSVVSNPQNTSGRADSKVEKAQTIQQREQLKKMVTEKFVKDLSKGSKNITKIIQDIVAKYFESEKVTEDSLRQLKATVSQAVGEYKQNNPTNSVKGSSVASKKESNAEHKSRAPSQKSARSGAQGQSSRSSNTSS